MRSFDKMQISKLNAAESQLADAIAAWFDPCVSTITVHTIAAATHGILRDLLLTRGDGSFIKDIMIKPEYRKEVNGIINQTQNFLKHADRDAEITLDFSAGQTMFLLVDCVDMHARLTQSYLMATMLFKGWFATTHPKYVADSFTQRLYEAKLKIFTDEKELLKVIRADGRTRHSNSQPPL